MTWSIIARDNNTGQFGIAVATRFFAVGALVPHLKSRVGAIATQALVNLFYGTEGLRLLEQGASAKDIVAKLVGADAAAVVHDADALDAALLDLDVDAAAAGVHGVFEELLDDARRPFDHLAGGDLGHDV